MLRGVSMQPNGHTRGPEWNFSYVNPPGGNRTAEMSPVHTLGQSNGLTTPGCSIQVHSRGGCSARSVDCARAVTAATKIPIPEKM